MELKSVDGAAPEPEESKRGLISASPGINVDVVEDF